MLFKSVLDSDITRRFGSLEVGDGNFVKEKIETWADLGHFLEKDSGYPAGSMKALLDLHPDTGHEQDQKLVPPIGSISDRRTFERVKMVQGDIEFNAAQRFTCQEFSKRSECFSYRFDAVLSWSTDRPA
ncbi:hypothetical protein LZ554_003807 [Drepanopeziza brunnea f. sp. 'monogermtubi']|nr:hypothetical protein LZ554_003807 [Drepanopeziza brunnea f. sp. 'monogermtubi']